MSTDPHHIGPDEMDWPRLLADATLEGVLIHEHGRILCVNAALARMLGYDVRAMVGMMGTELAVPEDRDRLLRHIEAETEQPMLGIALRADGGTFPAEIRGRIIGSVTAKQVRLYGTAYIDGDITHEQLAMETGAFFQGRSLKFQRAQPALTAVTSEATIAAAE